MTSARRLSLTLVALAAMVALPGCGSMPANNAALEGARSDYRAAQDNPQTRELAAGELKQAGEALGKADAAWLRRDSLGEVDHLAYLAKQRVAVAQQAGAQKAAEQGAVQATADRDKLRLTARTNEADAAQRSAAQAQQQAEQSQRQAAASQRQAADAQAMASQLEARIAEMNAKKTERGLVITIGDVLFDTNRAELKAGGLRSMEKLVGFLAQYPLRKALVEGYTDSVGGDGSNQALSGRRADAVRAALVGMGVGTERVATRGMGEAYPVASNDSAAGRQLNRRVEIVLSDDSGAIVPR
ncbi:MAG TPA: OmpA family protein [Ideonella sp.]|nr:OmpA family protein [Ideonella sp.]